MSEHSATENLSGENPVGSPRPRVAAFSFSRILTIAGGTITQLVRMKTFYFLLAFAVLATVLTEILTFPDTPVRQLSQVKKGVFGAMDLFAWLYTITATALLIPKDIEDRTLYTILCKPVRRIEYLFGKLIGVLTIVAISLVIMFTICSAIIFAQESTFIAAEVEAMQADSSYSQREVERQVALIQEQGVRPELAVAALASFLKAAVVAGMTLFLSTFASSSLFTIIVAVLLFLIGHAHTLATGYWLAESGRNIVVQQLVKVFKIIIPDFQIFAFSEGIVLGEAVSMPLVGNMCLLTLAYLVVFLLLSLLVFVDKEF
ncbi:MAG: hypothetical protein AAF236_01960 [Verrucomicrobiota bacterium]